MEATVADDWSGKDRFVQRHRRSIRKLEQSDDEDINCSIRCGIIDWISSHSDVLLEEVGALVKRRRAHERETRAVGIISSSCLCLKLSVKKRKVGCLRRTGKAAGGGW